jgi:hypothetical protein
VALDVGIGNAEQQDFGGGAAAVAVGAHLGIVGGMTLLSPA